MATRHRAGLCPALLLLLFVLVLVMRCDGQQLGVARWLSRWSWCRRTISWRWSAAHAAEMPCENNPWYDGRRALVSECPPITSTRHPSMRCYCCELPGLTCCKLLRSRSRGRISQEAEVCSITFAHSLFHFIKTAPVMGFAFFCIPVQSHPETLLDEQQGACARRACLTDRSASPSRPPL